MPVYHHIGDFQCFIKELRNIFKKGKVTLLYLFLEKYSNSNFKLLKSFADGLKRDMDVVENAVAYEYSNVFLKELTAD